MATKEDQENLRLLVQYVSRAFYEPKFVVILDQLARHPVLKDDDLAGRIGLQAKELNKVMAILTNDKLVQVHRQNELKENAQRSIGRQYYYVDYQRFCNVVKWRVAEMHRLIDSTARNELSTKGFRCPNCNTTFTTLEADHLMNWEMGLLLCDICPTSPGGPHEVVENNKDEGEGKNDRMERFNYQTKFIQEGLRKSESMTLPAFDVAVWIKNNVHDVEKAKQAQNGGLKIAGADGKKEDQGISIMMSVDKDEATRRKEREAEADAKRQQNMLPSWHLKSTISNDLTSLGVAAANQMANGKLTANEAILSGLGKPVSDGDILTGLGRANTQKKDQDTLNIIEEEKKPDIDEQTAYYDKWYADLEANSRAQSAIQTPRLELPLADFGDEDRKPDIALLDAAFNSQQRKRSRSPIDDESERGNKALRSTAGTPVYSQPASAVASPAPTTDPSPLHAENGISTVSDPDEPMVMVGGEPMPLSQVTQELADEKMSAEEYTSWYEVMMAQGL